MRKTTKKAEDTKKIAGQLARKILKRGPGGGATVIALRGELGSGKTTFVQGFYSGFGLKKRAVSPTFIILRRTALKNKNGFKNLFHMDTYRLRSAGDTGPLGLKKLFKEPGNLFLIEWAENIKKALPKETAWIKFFHGKTDKERTLIF